MSHSPPSQFCLGRHGRRVRWCRQGFRSVPQGIRVQGELAKTCINFKTPLKIAIVCMIENDSQPFLAGDHHWDRPNQRPAGCHGGLWGGIKNNTNSDLKMASKGMKKVSCKVTIALVLGDHGGGLHRPLQHLCHHHRLCRHPHWQALHAGLIS